MTIALMDEEEARAMIRARLESRAWWAIIDVGGSGVPGAIEDRHYMVNGRSSEDFEVMLCPYPLFPDGSRVPGVVSVALAHKRRMDAAELARILREAGAGGGDPMPERDGRDVIFLGDRELPEMLDRMLMVLFARWLDG